MNWSQIKRLLKIELENFSIDKDYIGLARTKQVQTFCMNTIYSYFSSCMSKRHFVMLLFFHFLSIHRNKQAKSSENELDTLYNLLKLVFTDNNAQNLLEYASSSEKPDFINLNSWLNCIKLEKFGARPNCPNKFFQKLTKSLSINSKKWLEYFQMDQSEKTSIDLVEKDIDLLNDTPFEVNLNQLEKLIIWLCIRPDKTYEILSKFNVYNFGGLVPSREEFSVKSAFCFSLPSTPILVNIPKNGNLFIFNLFCL